MKRHITAICLSILSLACFAQSYNITNIHFDTETTIEEEKTIIPQHSFLMQNFFFGHEQQAFGLTAGQVKRFGWFANVMLGTGLHFHGDYKSYGHGFGYDSPYGDLWVQNGAIQDEYGNWCLPAYSGKASHNMFSLAGGAVARLFKGTYLYFGIGYGCKSVTWQLKSKEWVEMNNKSYGSAFSVNTGLMLNIKNVSASVGVITIEDFVGVNFGIGLYKAKIKEPN